MNPIAQFIAAQPGAVERHLAEHTDDGTGRCRVCSAGPQAGRVTWPCRLHSYVQAAADLVARTTGGRS